jgi:hypothetical protein
MSHFSFFNLNLAAIIMSWLISDSPLLSFYCSSSSWLLISMILIWLYSIFSALSLYKYLTYSQYNPSFWLPTVHCLSSSHTFALTLAPALASLSSSCNRPRHRLHPRFHVFAFIIASLGHLVSCHGTRLFWNTHILFVSTALLHVAYFYC